MFKNDKKLLENIYNNSTNNNFKSLKEPSQELLFRKTDTTFDDFSQKNSNSSIVETHNNDTLLKSLHDDLSNELAFFPGYVVFSRGKRNARNEEQMKRSFNLNIIKNLNICAVFHFLLSREIDRLNELCDKCTAIKEEIDITEDGQYHIHQAIGQTTLLISKKYVSVLSERRSSTTFTCLPLLLSANNSNRCWIPETCSRRFIFLLKIGHCNT
ncbi:uncharacterized protein LOC117223216 [Megalopta genalis]|uniref:uncharacterized protein LOC117223216 n=1 Tax=Megalopta genalis TaxID=115081 RepID=UPI003FD0FC59